MAINPCILLIGNSSLLSKMIQEARAETGRDAFDLECATRLSEGLERLTKDGIEAVLVDLALPDSQGLETLEKLFRAALHIPNMVLCDERTEGLSKQALKRGAQDYLLKNHLDSYTLARALNGAIGRKVAEDALFVEKERAQVTLNSIGDPMLSTDILGSVTYLNLVAGKNDRRCARRGNRPAADRSVLCGRPTYLYPTWNWRFGKTKPWACRQTTS